MVKNSSSHSVWCFNSSYTFHHTFFTYPAFHLPNSMKEVRARFIAMLSLSCFFAIQSGHQFSEKTFGITNIQYSLTISNVEFVPLVGKIRDGEFDDNANFFPISLFTNTSSMEVISGFLMDLQLDWYLGKGNLTMTPEKSPGIFILMRFFGI